MADAEMLFPVAGKSRIKHHPIKAKIWLRRNFFTQKKYLPLGRYECLVLGRYSRQRLVYCSSLKDNSGYQGQVENWTKRIGLGTILLNSRAGNGAYILHPISFFYT